MTSSSLLFSPHDVSLESFPSIHGTAELNVLVSARSSQVGEAAHESGPSDGLFA
jgi:hypothetical protein